MKICVHLHLFYTEMLDEMLRYIGNLSAYPEIEYDLLVTVCEPNKTLEAQIYAFKDNARIITVPNRGYDVAPFLQAVKTVNLDDYDYIIKLHTKRDLKTPAYLPCCTLRGSEWRHKLLEFIASPKNLAATFRQFEKYPNAGMLTAPELIMTSGKEDAAADSRAVRILKGMGLQLKNRRFAAGTMFIARAELFKLWQALPYDAADFEEFNPSHQGGTLAHALERVLGFMIGAQGHKIISYYPFSLSFLLKTLCFRTGNFFFYKRVNSKNKLHIKICKIPVYSKQLKL